jgi:TP901-1 family phage major tail protein
VAIRLSSRFKLCLRNPPNSRAVGKRRTTGPLWTETLAGLKNVSVTGDGFFEDSATEARMNAVAMNADSKANFQVVVPDFGSYGGAFRITSLEFGGETEGGVTYSLSLESTGAVEFTGE